MSKEDALSAVRNWLAVRGLSESLLVREYLDPKGWWYFRFASPLDAFKVYADGTVSYEGTLG